MQNGLYPDSLLGVVQLVVSCRGSDGPIDSQGCQVDARRPRVEGAGLFFPTSLLQLPAVERLPRAKNEVWILGPQTPSAQRRPEGAPRPWRLGR